MAVEEINRRTLRFGVTYLETTDNPMDSALAIGAGRSPTILMPRKGDIHYAADCVHTIKASGRLTADIYTLTEIELRRIPAHHHAAFEERE